MIISLLLMASAALAEPRSTIENPKLSGYPFLALTPQERTRSAEEQVETAYTRASNLCNFLGLPKGEYQERAAAFVQLSLQRPNDPINLLAMTSQGQWKTLIVTFPGTDFSANFSRVVCEGRN
jgi:hypothetical protein